MFIFTLLFQFVKCFLVLSLSLRGVLPSLFTNKINNNVTLEGLAVPLHTPGDGGENRVAGRRCVVQYVAMPSI